MCENRVNTHSHRAYSTENILNVKELAIHFSPVLLTVSSDLYLRNGAPPLQWRQHPCVLILRRYRSAFIVSFPKRRIFL